MEGTESSTGIKNRTDNNYDLPKMYKVIFYNDDFTTFEFVILVLTKIFHKSTEEAETLAQVVDKEGEAIIGSYSLDMAKTKTKRTLEMAREKGFPLVVKYMQE